MADSTLSVDPVPHSPAGRSAAPASSAARSGSGSTLLALPVDRDYLAEARELARVGWLACAHRGILYSPHHLLAYEHFVRTLTDVIAEKQAVIDALSGARTESREREA